MGNSNASRSRRSFRRTRDTASTQQGRFANRLCDFGTSTTPADGRRADRGRTNGRRLRNTAMARPERSPAKPEDFWEAAAPPRLGSRGAKDVQTRVARVPARIPPRVDRLPRRIPRTRVSRRIIPTAVDRAVLGVALVTENITPSRDVMRWISRIWARTCINRRPPPHSNRKYVSGIALRNSSRGELRESREPEQRPNFDRRAVLIEFFQSSIEPFGIC
jgi:hypothetical protein